MRTKLLWATVLAGLTLLPSRADAMPNFARRYHVDCAACHDAPTYPRLNDFGYKFRRAGFRLPEEIGQDVPADFNLGDFYAARIQVEGSYQHVKDNRNSTNQSEQDNQTLQMNEITLYPINGSFQKYWGSMIEMSVVPDETPEIENAYLRFVWGRAEAWLEARAGIMHQFEGFGAADRPINLTRPLFETRQANNGQNTLFTLWNLDRIGAEIGYQWRNTSLTAVWYSRLNTVVENGNIIGVGVTPNNEWRKDFMLSLVQILGRRSGVQALWLHGQTRLPVSPTDFLAGTSDNTWGNVYDSVALFGSVGFGRYIALAGFNVGVDHTLRTNPTTGARDRPSFTYGGAFGELDAGIRRGIAAFARFDYFDPSWDRGNDQTLGGTIGLNLYSNWVYMIPEAQLLSTDGRDGHLTTFNLRARAIVIY